MNEKYLKIKELFDLALQHYKENNFLSAEKLYKKILEMNQIFISLKQNYYA